MIKKNEVKAEYALRNAYYFESNKKYLKALWYYLKYLLLRE